MHARQESHCIQVKRSTAKSARMQHFQPLQPPRAARFAGLPNKQANPPPAYERAGNARTGGPCLCSMATIQVVSMPGNSPRWDRTCRGVEVLEKWSESEWLYRYKIDPGFPLSPRDMVYYGGLSRPAALSSRKWYSTEHSTVHQR